MRYISSMMAVLLTCSSIGQAQNADSVALVRRAGQVATWIGGAAMKLDTLFAPSLLAQMPAAQLSQVPTQLSPLGPVTAIKMTSRPAPGAPSARSALFQLTTAKGYTIPTTLVIDASSPNLIAGMLFGSPTRT